MLEYLKAIAPVVVPLFVWIIAIETRLARIETNLTWIKKALGKCQRT
jgi:hypothetical protein